jgi:hypothetical protein
VALSSAPPINNQTSGDLLSGEAPGDAKLSGFRISQTFRSANPNRRKLSADKSPPKNLATVSTPNDPKLSHRHRKPGSDCNSGSQIS